MRLQRIEIKKNGQYVSIQPEAFLALPLAERLGFILQRAVRFYDGAGNAIPLQEGGRILRDQEAPPPPLAPPAPPPVIPMEGDGHWSVSLSVFLQLPLDIRLPLLVDRRVVFRDPRGEEIPFREGLRLMRAAQVAGGVSSQNEGVSVAKRA